MDGLEPVGRILVVAGIGLVVVGGLLGMGVRLPLLGNLPGDIRISGDHVTLYIPLASMLVVSLVLSVVLALVGRR